MLSLKKGNMLKLGRLKNGLVSTFLFSLCKQCRETQSYFSHYNKGFINYVYFRNWSVGNPAGTRLDSLAWQINKFCSLYTANCTVYTVDNTWIKKEPTYPEVTSWK